MQRGSDVYNKIKEGFAQAEEDLKDYGQSSFKKREIRDKMWIFLYNNQGYYSNVFKREMWEISAEFDEGEFADCFFNTINIVLNNYDAEKGKLEHFFNRQWSYRLKDKANEIKKRRVMEESIDKDDDEDDKNEKEKKKKKEIENPNPSGGEIDDDNMADILVELLNAITHLNEHKPGRNSKKTYFKMFFTDFITEYCKNFKISWGMKNREKSIFAGLQTDFLDFYMREHCQTLKRIQSVPLKSMQEIKGKGSDEEIKLPLPNQVYIIYLGLASSGNVTQMRDKYWEFCEKLDEKLNIRKELMD